MGGLNETPQHRWLLHAAFGLRPWALKVQASSSYHPTPPNHSHPPQHLITHLQHPYPPNHPMIHPHHPHHPQHHA